MRVRSAKVGRRRARIGVLGGTFDHLHAGHRRLFAAAFRDARRVGIGVTTDAYLRAHAKAAARRLQPYRVRRAAVTRFLRRRFPPDRWWVVPLENYVGGALQPEVELLVASAETRVGARQVNAERRRRGLRPLRLRFIPIALADDLLPLSSTRIRQGLVDREGRRRRPVRIAYPRNAPPSLPDRVARELTSLFPTPVRFRWIPRPAPRTAPRPSPARAMAQAVAIRGDADWAIGVAVPRAASDADPQPWVAVAGPTGPVPAAPSAGKSRRTVEGQLRAQFGPLRRNWVGRPSARRLRA